MLPGPSQWVEKKDWTILDRKCRPLTLLSTITGSFENSAERSEIKDEHIWHLPLIMLGG